MESSFKNIDINQTSSHSAYMKLFNRMTDPAFIYNNKGIFISNNAFDLFFGDECISIHDFINFTVNNDRERVYSTFMKGVTAEADWKRLDFLININGEKTVETSCYIESILIANEKMHQVVIRNDPIFYQKQSARSEQTDQKELEEYFQGQQRKSLATLVSGVTHEINNPVNLIILNIHSLKKTWMDFLPHMKRINEENPLIRFGGLNVDYLENNLSFILDDINSAAKKISNIIGKLKHFVKNTKMLDKSNVNLNKAVLRAGKMWSMAALKSYTELDMDLEKDLPDIYGNQGSLEQIVYNLLVNADEAIYHDHGKIRVATKKSGEGHIRLIVEDNGRGINEEVRDTLFDPFVTDRLEEGGSGLGLSVTFSLVKAHEGNISFDTFKGKGTVFIVEFPITQAMNLKS